MIYTLVSDRGDVRIIKLLVENIMFFNYDQVFDKIKNSISDESCRVVLDMEKVTFMDSLSIGMLVPLLLYTKRLEGNLVVANLNERIHALFKTLSLDKIIHVYGSLDEAVKSFT